MLASSNRYVQNYICNLRTHLEARLIHQFCITEQLRHLLHPVDASKAALYRITYGEVPL